MSEQQQMQELQLGCQPRFPEMKLSLDSHKDANVSVNGKNDVTVKLKAGHPVKVTARLLDINNGKKEVENLILTQRKDKGEVRFTVGFPKDGLYKLEIFALEEEKAESSLPNVYNYLFKVKDVPCPAIPFAKVYTKFYTDCCFLEEPLALNSSTKNLKNTKFELSVPNAEKVAIHCGEKWFQLEKKGKEWKGFADLEEWRGKNTKVTVNACYEKESSSYSVLLEYII